MGRPSTGGHVRQFPRHKTAYRLISVEVDGVRRQRFEHRLVMEKKLGRKLRRDEIVHHRDEDGLNNAEDNLEVTSQPEHVRTHLQVGPAKWDLDTAVDMRAAGLSFEEVGALFDVSYTAVLRAFARRGLPTADKRIGTNTWDVTAAIAQYEAGASLRSVAVAAGVKPPSARKAFLKRGVKLRERL